jgi:hypothetical protein
LNAREERAMLALGRTLRMWSLINMLPIASLLPLQPALLHLFTTHPDSTEDELVKLGLKHLYKKRHLSRAKNNLTLSRNEVAVLLRSLQR